MIPEGIGTRELGKLLRRHWVPILGSAVLCGVLALIASALTADVYAASAKLVVFPAEGQIGSERPVELYHSLLESDRIYDETVKRLIEEGVLSSKPGALRKRDLTSSIEGQNRSGGSVLVLTARAASPDRAAAIANAWARTFIENSRSMLQSTASETEKLLEDQLSPIRQQLVDLEAERYRLIDEDQEKRDKELSLSDARISAARTRAERAAVLHETETRRQMEEVVSRNLTAADAGTEASDASFRSLLLELVSVRAELAKTPRVLTLENALGNEDFSELIMNQGDSDPDRTLISQAINPLYDQLALKALQLESDLKRVAHDSRPDIMKAMVELEEVQRDRTVGLTQLVEEGRLELRTLDRQRRDILLKLGRQRSMALAGFDRQISQLEDLEGRLSKSLNNAVVNAVLERVGTLGLAAPAIPPRRPESPRTVIQVAAAGLAGGMLCLMAVLFRSAGRAPTTADPLTGPS